MLFGIQRWDNSKNNPKYTMVSLWQCKPDVNLHMATLVVIYLWGLLFGAHSRLSYNYHDHTS